MMQWFTKLWLPISQWSILAFLASFAFYNSATDHGWQMALNCVCIGFVFSCMLLRPLIDARHKVIDAILADMNATKEKFDRAVEEGRIEVVLLRDDAQQTVH